MYDPDSREDMVFIKRKRGTILIHGGFQYYRHQVYKNKSTIWRCSAFKKDKCSGSMTINENNSILKKRTHICSPDFVKNEIALKVDNMRKEVVNTDKPITKIYNENMSKMKDDGYNLISNLPSFHNIYHGLYITRNKSLDVNKTVFTNLEDVQVPAKFFNFVLADYFYNRERILIFCSQESRELIGEIKEFFIDGTFKNCPKPFTQLYCIHGEFNSSIESTSVKPLIYILLCNKKEQSYNIVFQILKSQLPQFLPVKVHCDLELGAINALESVFPKVHVVLCYYHWTRNIWKRAKLTKHTDSKAERRIVALCAALPLLPPFKIKNGWEYIINESSAEYFKMAQFLSYIQKFWIKKHLNKLSVFGERHRTNNPVEGWHAKLNRHINKNNVTLLRLLNVLVQFENIFMINKGQIKRKKGDILNDKFIRNIQIELINNEIGVGHALEKLRV